MFARLAQTYRYVTDIRQASAIALAAMHDAVCHDADCRVLRYACAGNDSGRNLQYASHAASVSIRDCKGLGRFLDCPTSV